MRFITLQLEFFNFLSLVSGKLKCFAILAVGIDINLKKPSFIEGCTAACLAFVLVSTCFRHSHSSLACLSSVQNLAEVFNLAILLPFISHQRSFLCLHFFPCLSASPLQHLPTLAGKGCKILSSLMHGSGCWYLATRQKGYG